MNKIDKIIHWLEETIKNETDSLNTFNDKLYMQGTGRISSLKITLNFVESLNKSKEEIKEPKLKGKQT